MNIYLLCGGGICALCAVIILRQMKSELASHAAALSAAIIGVYCIASLAEPIKYLRDIACETGINGYFTLMLKCLCTAFLCKTASDICRDCGENAIGSKIELGGRIMILLQTLPVVKNIFETAKSFL